MAYCTLDDILLRYPFKDILELTQDDAVATSIDTTRTVAAISDASDLIDSKIHKRYNVPLSPIPARITRIAVDLATYFIYKLRYDTKVPEQIDITYKEAIQYLDSIKNGDDELVGLDYKDGNDFIIVADFEQLDGSITNDEFNKI